MCIGYSDAHFGQPRNLIQPGRAEIMADGWETARKVGFVNSLSVCICTKVPDV